jgi:hypothetical protein
LRYFFRRRMPPSYKVLLIESGSRHLIEQALPALHEMFGRETEFGLLTCYQGEPSGFRGPIYRINDYGGAAGREEIAAELEQKDYSVAGIICAAEPIMTKWKWWLIWRLPVKVFIINENADFFWFDRGHWRTILRFALYRAGLSGAAAVPALLRLIFFPVTLAYLLLYAGTVHLRRRIRLL